MWEGIRETEKATRQDEAGAGTDTQRKGGREGAPLPSPQRSGFGRDPRLPRGARTEARACISSPHQHRPPGQWQA